MGVSAGQVTYLQPASVRLWKPGWQRSHLSPVTPGLHVHTPLLSHCSDWEPGHTSTGTAIFVRTEPWGGGGAHRQRCSRRADSGPRPGAGGGSPGSAHTWGRPCCRRSFCSDLRDPWPDTARHRRNTRCSSRYSCRLSTADMLESPPGARRADGPLPSTQLRPSSSSAAKQLQPSERKTKESSPPPTADRKRTLQTQTGVKVEE